MQATTTTTLSSSAPSAVYGQNVTFTATVSGNGVATGSVAFYSGPVDLADEIGTGTLSVVGGSDVATFSTHSLAVSQKPYAITAVYGGDSGDLGSTSNVLSETVGPDGTITVASSSTSSSNFGQAITLSAAVTPSGRVRARPPDRSTSTTRRPPPTLARWRSAPARPPRPTRRCRRELRPSRKRIPETAISRPAIARLRKRSSSPSMRSTPPIPAPRSRAPSIFPAARASTFPAKWSSTRRRSPR